MGCSFRFEIFMEVIQMREDEGRKSYNLLGGNRTVDKMFANVIE